MNCLIGIQLEPIGRHPICNSCQTSGNLLQQGADIRRTTCTINLSVISVEVRRQAVQFLNLYAFRFSLKFLCFCKGLVCIFVCFVLV